MWRGDVLAAIESDVGVSLVVSHDNDEIRFFSSRSDRQAKGEWQKGRQKFHSMYQSENFFDALIETMWTMIMALPFADFLKRARTLTGLSRCGVNFFASELMG